VTERVLSERELNRATLARQLLLARGRLPVARAVQRIAGLQAQYSPGPYVNLWSRIEGFRIEQLERALTRRTVIKASLLRNTLHLVAAQDYPAFAVAMIPRLTKHWRMWHKREDIPGIDELATRAAEHAAAEPRLAEELRTLVAELAPGEDPKVALWRVWTHTPFVEVPPSGTWRYFGKARLAPGETWVGARFPPFDEAVTRLCERRLRPRDGQRSGELVRPADRGPAAGARGAGAAAAPVSRRGRARAARPRASTAARGCPRPSAVPAQVRQRADGERGPLAGPASRVSRRRGEPEERRRRPDVLRRRLRRREVAARG
jgi:hypothetical protein